MVGIEYRGYSSDTVICNSKSFAYRTHLTFLHFALLKTYHSSMDPAILIPSIPHSDIAASPPQM